MYAYQADVWCDECGEEICERLQRGTPESGDSDDYRQGNRLDTGDSGDYPQWADEDDCESDSPSHCAAGADCKNYEHAGDQRVGAILGGLTAAGREYVLDHLREDAQRSEVVLLWREHFELDWPEECRTVHLSNTEDDPTQVMCEVQQTYAADWADDDRYIEGSTWETPSDMPGFAYTIIMWHPGLTEDLELQGYKLDLSEYSDPEPHEVSTAVFAAEWFDGDYHSAAEWIEEMFSESWWQMIRVTQAQFDFFRQYVNKHEALRMCVAECRSKAASPSLAWDAFSRLLAARMAVLLFGPKEVVT